MGGIATSNPLTLNNGTTMSVFVTETDGASYARTTTDGVNFAGWSAQVNSRAATVPQVGFNNRTYTFVKGAGNQPHLCFISQ